jgi:hypothetical protein
MTVQSLWDHYFREELPFKDFSTQDAYTSYARNWILPRWGGLLLQKIKTVEIERWLRDATGSNGTKAKVKCIMSALFSHAVRWEFTSSNPISSGISVGSGGKRSQHGCSGERKTSESANGFIAGTIQARSHDA